MAAANDLSENSPSRQDNPCIRASMGDSKSAFASDRAITSQSRQCSQVPGAASRPDRFHRQHKVNANPLEWPNVLHRPFKSGCIFMKIGTLLTIAIASISAVGGGLAVYVAATKYETMTRISDAKARLEVVRAVGDIPRYLNPERGFATNILFGPAEVDPKLVTELGGYRKQTDGAVDKMIQWRKASSGAL